VLRVVVLVLYWLHRHPPSLPQAPEKLLEKPSAAVAFLPSGNTR
jgi:hypothetical protein